MLIESLSSKLFARCDGLDGPVVKDVRKALDTGTINFGMIWIFQQDEGEVRQAFEKTLAIRKLAPKARELADRYLLRARRSASVQRTSEGAHYTSLKPSGRDLGPAIPAADKASERASSKPWWRSP